MKNKKLDIKVVDLSDMNPEDALGALGEIIGGKIRQDMEERRHFNKLANELALITCKFHMDIVMIGKKYGRDPKDLMFDAVKALVSDLQNGDGFTDVTDEDLKAYEELKKAVEDAAK